MLLLVYTVVSATHVGWLQPRTVVSLAAGVIAPVRGVHPGRTPWSPTRWCGLGVCAAAASCAPTWRIVGLIGSFAAFQFILTLYLQSALGWQPLQMALALLPAGLLVVFSAPWAGWLIDRFGTPRLIVTGLAAMTTGYLVVLADRHPPGLRGGHAAERVADRRRVRARLPSINVQATSGIADHEQGLAAGLVQTSGQVGAALVLGRDDRDHLHRPGRSGTFGRGDARRLPAGADLRDVRCAGRADGGPSARCCSAVPSDWLRPARRSPPPARSPCA